MMRLNRLGFGNKTTKAFCIIALGLSFTASTAAVATTSLDTPETAAENRLVSQVGANMRKRLFKIQKYMATRKFDKAKSTIEKALNRKSNSPFETARVLQMKGIVAAYEGNHEGTVSAYEQIIRLRDNIPYGFELSILSNLASIQYQREEYQDASKYLDLWFDTAMVVNPAKHIFQSKIQYQLGNYDKTVAHYNKAIADSFVAQEAWDILAISAQWQAKRYPEMEAMLASSLKRWPDNQAIYCKWLGGVSFQMHKTGKKAAVADVVNRYSVCKGMVSIAAPGAVPPGSIPADLPENNWHSKGLIKQKHETLAFPRNALRRGVSGYVVVEYDVAANGSVNPDKIKILRAEPKDYFEETALQTAATFVYEPLLIDGKAQQVSNVRYRLTFNAQAVRAQPGNNNIQKAVRQNTPPPSPQGNGY